MENIIYLDNASTTKPFKESIEAYRKFSYLNYFNPSSIHKGGIKLKTRIEKAREYFAKLFDGSSEEIIFTSGATESNNTVIKSIGEELSKNEHIATTPIEHKSIRKSIKNYRYKQIKIKKNGQIDLKDLKTKISKKTKLLSFILTNNETGIIQNYSKIITSAKDINPNILIHIDAAQSFGKGIFNFKNINADYISISGHKLHAPKGIGVLYKSNNALFSPILKGGSQENKNRAGTENTGGIMGFYKSTQKYLTNKEDYLPKLKSLSKHIKMSIRTSLDNYLLNSYDTENFQDNIISIYHKYIPGSVMLKSLSDRNIYISTGSACNEKSKNLNPVLKAHNFDKNRIINTFRVSLSIFNSKSEIEEFLKALKDINKSLSSIYKKAKGR